MAVATVEISETNGASTVTDGIANLNLVSLDGANVTSSDYPVTAGNRSVSKWVRIHLIDINESNKIDNFQVWMTPDHTTTDVDYLTNLNTSLALTTSTYPTNNPSSSDFTGVGDGAVETAGQMPFADPGVANIGVSEGTGGLSSNDSYSDYIAIQLLTGGSTPPGNLPTKTFHFQYDEQ